MATMGMAIIMDSLKEASYLFVGTSKTYNVDSPKCSKIAKQSFAFIQGSGLDITIRRFHLDLNADEIRDNFNRIFHVQ